MPRKNAQPAPIHPGVTLSEDFLQPLSLSANRLAMELHVPVTRINDILRARRSITADTALRLARYFGTSPKFWLNLQLNYDLEVALVQNADLIHKQVTPRKPHTNADDPESAMQQIWARLKLVPNRDTRPDDEILGYGPDGLPT